MKKTFFKLFLILVYSGLVPGLSIAQTVVDSTIIRAWELQELNTEKQPVEIDTMITSFQVHNPVFIKSISSSWLGNTGLAARSNIFSERGPYSDFIFINHFQEYLIQPHETRFYNTRRPFSLIDFSSGGPRGQNEKILNVLHTQNINPDFNAGIRYLNINSDGQYPGQSAVTNAIALFSSYELDEYEFHASINLNSANAFENGGLKDDSYLEVSEREMNDSLVRLNDVRNGIRNTSIFFSHSWKPFFYSSRDTLNVPANSWFSGFQIYHVVHFDQYKRSYLDPNPAQPEFYPEILINNSITNDSVYYRNLTNMLMVKLPSFSRGAVSFDAKGGLKNELVKGSYNIYNDTVFHFSDNPDPSSYLFARPSDTIVIDRDEHKYSTSAIIATARGNIGDVFTIWGEGNLYFQGYKSGEYDIKAGIRFDFFEGKNQAVIAAEARQQESVPSLFLNSYYSNHFAWQNDFRLSGESSLSGSIKMPERSFDAGVSFHLLNNYIYFDNTANPMQHTDVFPVMNISLSKDIRLWRFHFRNILRYQASGNQDILPLPDLSIYSSTWFEQPLISNVLIMQIGFDIYYTTEFQGYAYQPATSQFYLQNERNLGNYPYIDAFINFKHKRTRVFFKAEHANSGFMSPDYFSVLHYPRNQRVLKFGLSWSFYN